MLTPVERLVILVALLGALLAWWLFGFLAGRLYEQGLEEEKRRAEAFVEEVSASELKLFDPDRRA